MTAPTPVADQHQAQEDNEEREKVMILAAITQKRIAWTQRELRALEYLIPEARLQPLDAAVIGRLEHRLLYYRRALEDLTRAAHADQDAVVRAGGTHMQWWDQLREVEHEVFVWSLTDPCRAEALERSVRSTLDAITAQERALKALQAFSPVDDDSKAGSRRQQDQMKRMLTRLRHQRWLLFELL